MKKKDRKPHQVPSGNTFEEIATFVCSGHRELRRCPDQYVCMVEVGEDRSTLLVEAPSEDFGERTNVHNWERGKGPIIIAIVESPHVSEYNLPHPGPAAGTESGDAGTALRTLFSEACPVQTVPRGTVPPLSPGRYPLVLMNAVQYQCSLGRNTKLYRNAVFLKCWETFGKTDFKARLVDLYEMGDLVIKCCTAACTRLGKLRDLVEAQVGAVVASGSHLKGRLTSWWRCAGRVC